MKSTFAKLLKSVKGLSRRQKIIIFGALATALVLPVTVFAATRHDEPKKPYIASESKSKPKPAKKDAKPEAKDTPQEPAAGTKPATTAPKSSAPQPAPAPAPQPAPAPRNVDFVLSTNSITIRPTETSSVITAHAVDGQPLAWVVAAPTQAPAYIITASGLTHGPSMVASHSFSFRASHTTQPGTYTAGVRGYLPRGPQVDKTITITVLPPEN